MHWIYGSEENGRDGKFEGQHYLDLPGHPGATCDIARKMA